MFEVGKKYFFKENNSKNITIFEPKYIGDAMSFGLVGTSEDCIPNLRFSHWKEYKEPQLIRGWVNVLKREDGTIRFGSYVYDSKDDANVGPPGSVIDTIIIEYTEK